MNSRQRVLTTLEHCEPDRVPLDLGGNQTGIHRVAYQKVLDYYGLDEDIEIMDPVPAAGRSQRTNTPAVRDRHALHPARHVPAARGVARSQTGILGPHRRFRRHLGHAGGKPGEGLYLDIIEHPLANLSYEDIDSYDWPDGKDPTPFKGLREYARKMYEETDYALVSGITGVVFEICWYMRGLSNLYMDMLEQPRYVEKLLDHTLAYWIDYLDTFLNEVGEYLQVICVGDDLAMQSGPLFSPKIYKSLVKPRQKQLYKR